MPPIRVLSVQDTQHASTFDDASLSEHTKGDLADVKIHDAESFADKEVEDLSYAQRWALFVEKIKAPQIKLLIAVTNHAAFHPKTYIVSTVVFSMLMLGLGLGTNFDMVTDENVWTPTNKFNTVKHGDWIEDESGFPEGARKFNIIVHAGGANLLDEAMAGVERIFEAINVIRSTPGYDDLCSLSETGEINDNGRRTCPIDSVISFWNNSLSSYHDTVDSDTDVISSMSASAYPSGEPVDRTSIFGNGAWDKDDALQSVESYLSTIELPPEDDVAEPFETEALDRIISLQNEWQSQGDIFRLEVAAERSFDDEFSRAIDKDIPLVPLVFMVMSVFCCIFFTKKDRVMSQSLLGFGAVINVLLAIMTSYGFLFTIGVPFTFLTQILPFIMFGIGLDDAFIITGAYERTDPKRSPEERVKDAISDVGTSVLLTTLTTTVAFSLGCISTVPAVRWLCLYASLCIIVDFVYQITFFVALIVTDEIRMQENKYDCAFCIKRTQENNAKDGSQRENSPPDDHVAERIMQQYCESLLKPTVKATVLVGFASLLGILAFNASKLEQKFEWTDIIPSDSYLKPFIEAFEDYSENLSFHTGVYFRDVDFSSSYIQDQMHKYVEGLEGLEYISDPPTFFWLSDFEIFLEENPGVDQKTFKEQVDDFLSDPVYHSLYYEDIVRDSDGKMTASRTWVVMDQVDTYDVTQQIEALTDQHELTKDQPVNQGLDDWKFFTFLQDYYIWSFYAVAVDELALSTALGVTAVTVISLLMIPHWSAVFFVAPVVGIIYVELLGVVKVAGLHLNVVTYVAMVMSIGLMVDFVMHVVVKYFESEKDNREGKVRDVLKTMGASILLGGSTTLLGVIPLAFSTSEIIWAIFVVFIGLVVLGLAHGLVLMPVLLSLLGPTETKISLPTKQEKQDSFQQSEP